MPSSLPYTRRLDCMKKGATGIGFRSSDGTISDAILHEEIMRGVNDMPLRIMSAKRFLAMGGTREQAEKLFSVKLPDDHGLISIVI